MVTTKFKLGIRKLEKGNSLSNFEKVNGFKNETLLLEYTIKMISSFDPDIIVGHSFLSFDLDILLQRMKAKNIGSWSKIGRLKRSEFPKIYQQKNNGIDHILIDRIFKINI
jgi:DNA polymerase elongation subunit (family B)